MDASLKRLSFTALVACLTAVVVSLALHVAWPGPASAQVQPRSMTVSSASLPLAGKAALIRVAERYVRLQAERQVGVSVDRQQVTSFWKRGSVVVVSLHDTLSNWNTRKTFDVDVTLNQGAWQPLGMHVVTENGPPPIGVPAPAS
jgi:hypothetical protein